MTTNVYTFDGFCARAINASSMDELRSFASAYLRDSVEGEGIVDDAAAVAASDDPKIVAAHVILSLLNPADEVY